MRKELEDWPALPLADWEQTYRTLHRFTQVVGKMRLALAPPINHWWHVALYINERGLTTSPMPVGGELMSLTFDLRTHRLLAENSSGAAESFSLVSMSVAEFFDRCCSVLGVNVKINGVPDEVTDRTPFVEDVQHHVYDAAAVERLHRILINIERVFQEYRGSFHGKSSPVHFFWGGFDVAVTRFSGKRNANPPPGLINREAYSHEVISHGFWPGGDFPNRGRLERPVFYSYALPEPAGFADADSGVSDAHYDKQFGEFFLPYDAVRTAANPRAVLRTFMDRTYEAGARLAGWAPDA